MKGWKDIKAVRFEFEFTSYIFPPFHICGLYTFERSKKKKMMVHLQVTVLKMRDNQDMQTIDSRGPAHRW